MKKNLVNRFKKGAASFYMVAFSTLILIIIVTSFAAVIISEVTRTANDDLSQSAYDSALAGVEDAKLIVYEYQKCKTNGGSTEARCGEIINSIESDNNGGAENKCSMVGLLLGRIQNSGEEVEIQETSGARNNMSQAYTCATIGFPNNLLTVLTAENSTKVFRVKFIDNSIAAKVEKVRISWALNDQDSNNSFKYFDSAEKKVEFGNDISTPPTLSVSMIQTASQFDLGSFERTSEDRTNRGTLFLVPVGDKDVASGDGSNYETADYDNENHIGIEGFLKSNDKTARNLPYTVFCPDNTDARYACTSTIDLPAPVDGDRNPETFVFVVSLPYGGDPDTEVSLEFLCGEDKGCEAESQQQDDGEEKKEAIATVISQVVIDSTGRANDMYRRVEVRLEGNTDYPLSIKGPLELLSNDENGDSSFVKDLSPTSEWCNYDTGVCNN